MKYYLYRMRFVRGELRRERVSKTKDDGESSEVTKIAFVTLGRSPWTIMVVLA